MRASRLYPNKTHYNVVFPVSQNQYYEDHNLIDLLKSFTIIDQDLKYNLKHFPHALISMRNHKINTDNQLEKSEFCDEETFDSLNKKVLSTIEIKVQELLQNVEQHHKIPSATGNHTFTDGSNMGTFWHTIKQDQKLDQPPYNQLKDNQILLNYYQKYLEKKNSK